MRIRHLLPVLLLPAALAFPQEKPAEKKATPKSGILVLNMFRVIEECDECRAVVATQREERATQVQKYNDEMQKLQEKVKVLREKKPQDVTPDYYKELEQAMATYARLEMDRNLFETKKGNEIALRLQQLLLGAQEEARKVMKERGAEIVLFSKMGPVEVSTEKDFGQELLMRRLICVNEEFDITNDVIARMNKWYAANKNTQGVPKREGEGAAEGEGKPAKDTSKDAEKTGDAGKGKTPGKTEK